MGHVTCNIRHATCNTHHRVASICTTCNQQRCKHNGAVVQQCFARFFVAALRQQSCIAPRVQYRTSSRCTAQQGLTDEAIFHCKAAIDACPTYAEVYNNMGVLYRDEGEIRLSIEYYDKYLPLPKP